MRDRCQDGYSGRTMSACPFEQPLAHEVMVLIAVSCLRFPRLESFLYASLGDTVNMTYAILYMIRT